MTVVVRYARRETFVFINCPQFADFFIFKRIDETQFGLVEVVLRTTPIGVTVFMILLFTVKMCPHTFFRSVSADADHLVILHVQGHRKFHRTGSIKISSLASET